ncbi:conserved hypothetical protein [Amycolatopsis xylanica]|uniref:Aspartate ammonia-lyase n=1 Tax=Amycolatopsis xylanica TaxID=589385 RepID=A0A1H3Q336_9PSEU|nr:DUF4139 domain-containing protein [Amycolatopsis xylanica]SDZ07591.1 conserved hypothetical protein [Amycolatopsis xylanica]
MPTELEAPITAVTVYPQQARITRRATAALDDRFVFTGLPQGLAPESVRVNGTGPASIVGVDVSTERHAEPIQDAIRELLDRRKELQADLDELADAEAVEQSRADLLTTLNRRSGIAFAKALATGKAGPERVAGVGDAIAEQLGDVLQRRRELAVKHAELDDAMAALDREMQARQSGTPDSTRVTVELEPSEAAGEITLELSYVVYGASWESTYDVRVRGDEVTLTWHGLISQNTGEDWPECDLALSTARPAATVSVPELDPWFLDRVQPIVPMPAAAAPMRGFGGAAPGGARMEKAADMAYSAATVEQGVAAATYRPSRPVAVPSDGSAHRTTVAVLQPESKLDYVTAPVRAEEAYLRAVVVNTSEHTLRPGNASIFHDAEFVGTTWLDPWAPGEEVELALGVDDRVRVERKLVRRSASKATLSGTKRREAEYRTTIANHSPREAKITVLDQVPVSRDDAIEVRDVRTAPEPVESTELGELTWQLTLAPGATGEVTLAFRVTVGKGVELSGWHE